MNCYAVGASYNNGNFTTPNGLILGNDPIQAFLLNCYYDANTNPSSNPVRPECASFEMMQGATFENWNFNTTWDIDEGVSYPWLRNNE